MAYAGDSVAGSVRRDYVIPSGHAGIEETVRHMRRLVRDAEGRPLLARTAARIIAGARTDGTAAVAIREWMDQHTRFEPDPVGVELIRTPEYMLEMVATTGEASGDCDDVAVLGAALGRAAGLPARFVLIGFRKGEPYQHVYTELGTPTGWLELDTTRPAQMPAGLEIARTGIRGA